APAPFNVVCPMTGSVNARPANSSAMRWFTRGILLVLNLGAQFLFYGRNIKGKLQPGEFLMNALGFPST
ncbi:MAG TPA: hypothetical protein VKD23_19645, partial [Terriglobales bacterium]|nr:hypothetical protein [Terriglobales bacterium]